jgi:hypothetical protein
VPVYVSNIVMHLCQQICEHVSMHDNALKNEELIPRIVAIISLDLMAINESWFLWCEPVSSA